MLRRFKNWFAARRQAQASDKPAAKTTAAARETGKLVVFLGQPPGKRMTVTPVRASGMHLICQVEGQNNTTAVVSQDQAEDRQAFQDAMARFTDMDEVFVCDDGTTVTRRELLG